MSLFRWLLNNPNGPIKTSRGLNLLTKVPPDPTVDETAAAIRKFSSSLETLRTLPQCEMNFSLFKQLLQDLNGPIEFTRSLNLLTKFQLNPTVNKVSGMARSCCVKLSLSFLSLSISADGYLPVRKSLKVNIGLCLHIGSEPNPTNLPLTTMWIWSTNWQSHNKFQTCFSVAS